MSTLPGTDWVYYASAGVLLLIALPLLYFALFRDRSRGRLRCPKCWYDMGGIATGAEPPFTCPECGINITTLNRLRHTRRRWGRAWLAGLVLLLSGVFAATPKARRDGAWSLLPDHVVWFVGRILNTHRLTSLNNALDRLAAQRDASQSDLIWYVEFSGAIHVRSPWVRGVPLRISHAGYGWGSAVQAVPYVAADVAAYGDTHENWWRSTSSVRANTNASGDKATVEFLLVHPGPSFNFYETVQLVERLDQAMTPGNSLPADLQTILQPRIVLVPTRNRPGLIVADIPAAADTATVYGLRAELMLNEKTIGIARWHQRANQNEMLGTPVYFRFDGKDIVIPTDTAEPPDLQSLAAQGCTVRFSTDEEMALADLQATHYWRGSFTIPLKDLLTPPPSK